MNKPQNSEDSRNEGIGGLVTARTCECCGHHEIGVLTPEDRFIPLRPGMKIEILSHLNGLEN